MKTKALTLALAALMGAAPICAMAQPMPGGGRGGPNQHGGPMGHNMRNGPRGGGGDRNRGGGYDRSRPMQPPQTWRRGERYWGGAPWISNWNRYPGLYAPPYGYRWVQAGNQFLLTAIATGVITAIITGSAVGTGAVATPYATPYPATPYAAPTYPVAPTPY
ncbi:hypothetical protein AA0472_2395 [Acetobacter estunensis NRIC 0472]|nr:RcnB family protein [Acetobacter estunensis]GBQ27419.1 hypothetical protein AA0472_2395 [Acetobacter estunensis NRIC 0472]